MRPMLRLAGPLVGDLFEHSGFYYELPPIRQLPERFLLTQRGLDIDLRSPVEGCPNRSARVGFFGYKCLQRLFATARGVSFLTESKAALLLQPPHLEPVTLELVAQPFLTQFRFSAWNFTIKPPRDSAIL